jgi:hypothetical protein
MTLTTPPSLMSKPEFPEEVRDFFQRTGQLGAKIHRITPEAARKGVQVRRAKANFQRMGYSSEAALLLARTANRARRGH